ncbi:SEL1-like repeat protein [Jiella marina]|uniref:SEL1-like repeat protein n=1 Tax=Jiella sp. LLJ827 TaxID=2917712 RepID=UPI002101A6C0|nr:SEL1-like repeat protein [Jiella sp. LLJ827]MCQ0987711.1 SEL1-like repeat protein [Jiella sp. LLJ827]
MTIPSRLRRFATLSVAGAFLLVPPAGAQTRLAQATANCAEAKDHFKIAREIGTPAAFQAHIDAFGACPYAEFARILMGQAAGAAPEPLPAPAEQPRETVSPIPDPVPDAAQAPAPGPAEDFPDPFAADGVETADPALPPAAPVPPPIPDAGPVDQAGQDDSRPDVAEDPFSSDPDEAAETTDTQPQPVPIPDPDASSADGPSDIASPEDPTAPASGEAKVLADTFVDRLNALQDGGGPSAPRVRYDSANLNRGDLFITNLRLTKDDGTPEWSGITFPTTVVLKPEIEADGTFVASSVFMSEGSIRAVTNNGPDDRVATIESASILSPRLPAPGSEAAGLVPITMTGFDIASIVGFDPAGEILKIDAIQLSSEGAPGDLPTSGVFTVRNLVFTPEQMARLSGDSVTTLAPFGDDFFDFTFTAMMQRDPAANTMQVRKVLEVSDEGRLIFSVDLANVTPSDIETILDAKNPAALLGLQAGLERAELSFTNETLVDKLLTFVAQTQNIDKPLFAAAIPTAARDAIRDATGNLDLAENVAAALRTFLAAPQSLALSVNPEQPVPIVSSAFQWLGSPDPVAQASVLRPAVSVNGGAPESLLLAALPSNDGAPAGGSEPPPVDPVPLLTAPEEPGASNVPEPSAGGATASVVAQCDQLAADSDDPTKPSNVAGVKAPEDIDYERAIPACEAAHRLVPDDARITFQLGRAYQAAGRDDEAARLYREAADAGQSVAQYELALAYYDGRGVEADVEKAIEQLQKSSAAGNGFSKYFLGIEKVNGANLPQDYPGAYQLFQEAAEFGVPEALVELGKMEYSGQGVPEDYAKAYDFYRQAAEQDVPGGHFYVGFMDAFGIGEPGATPLDAARNMMKGLALGYADAQELLVAGGGQIFDQPIRAAIQDYLRSEGFYTGNSDGILGPGTQQAINAWRNANSGG